MAVLCSVETLPPDPHSVIVWRMFSQCFAVEGELSVPWRLFGLIFIPYITAVTRVALMNEAHCLNGFIMEIYHIQSFSMQGLIDLIVEPVAHR